LSADRLTREHRRVKRGFPAADNVAAKVTDEVWHTAGVTQDDFAGDTARFLESETAIEELTALAT